MVLATADLGVVRVRMLLALLLLLVLIGGWWTLQAPEVESLRRTVPLEALPPRSVRLAPGRHAAPAAGTEAPPGVTVSGRVTDEIGRPVPGAVVRWMIRHEEVATTRTDAAGRYALRGPELSGDLEVAWGDVHRSIVWLYVEDAEDVPVRLERGGIQAGVVRAADGSPVGGARVLSYTREFAQARATTDAQGRFRLGAVPTDRHFSVYVEAGRHGRTRVEHVMFTEGALFEVELPPTFSVHGRVVRADDAQRRAVEGVRVVSRVTEGHGYRTFGEGTRTDAEGRFLLEGLTEAGTLAVEDTEWSAKDRVEAREGAPALLLRIAPTAVTVNARTLRGRVVDAAGKPVESVEVQTRGAQPATSNADGAFELRDVRPRHDGNTLWIRHADARGQVKVPGQGDADGVILRLERRPSIRGAVLDDDGRPLEGAAVEASWRIEKKDSIWLREEEAVADDTGRFLVTHLDDHPCDLTVEAPGHVTQTVREVRPCNGGRDVGAVVLPRCVLRRGRVTNERGEPLPSASYRIAEAKNFRWMPVDAAGTFEVEVAPDGAFEYLRVRAPGYLTASLEPLGPPWPDDLTFALRRAPVLRARVLDTDGEPVRGAQVRAWSGRGKMAEADGTYTDLEGFFHLEVTKPGAYDVHLSGTKALFARFLSLSTDDEDRVIRAVVPGRIEGAVLDARKRPLEGVTVWATIPGTCAVESVVTDAWGEFHFVDLAGDLFDLSVRGELEGFGFRPMDGVAVGRDDVCFQAEPTTTIRGRVTWPDGSPAAEVDVDAYPVLHAATSGWSSTDDDGCFEIEGLVQGRYVLEAWLSVEIDAGNSEEEEEEEYTGTTAPVETGARDVLLVLALAPPEDDQDDEDDEDE